MSRRDEHDYSDDTMRTSSQRRLNRFNRSKGNAHRARKNRRTPWGAAKQAREIAKRQEAAGLFIAINKSSTNGS